MTVLFTHEIHASEINGIFYNKGGVIGNKALMNYLVYCKNGMLISRCTGEQKMEEGSKYLRLNENGIEVIPIKEFTFKNLWGNYRIIKQNLAKADCYLIRLPGLTGLFVGSILWLNRKKYGVELAGDLVESLNEMEGNAVFYRRILIRVFAFLNNFLIRRSLVVGYRSKFLKEKYPHKDPQKELVFSGAQINKSDIGIAKARKHYLGSQIKLLYVGRLSPEKGLEYLIKAIVSLVYKNINIHLTIVGDGAQYDFLREIVRDNSICENVTFLGNISDRTEIHRQMDNAHIFVLPSITEGMPRSLIEAMARGMVAIGTNTGGIPELLEKCFLFEKKNVQNLVQKLEELISKRDLMHEISAKNIFNSSVHWDVNVQKIKREFWSKIIKIEN